MKKGFKILVAGIVATTVFMSSGYAFASETDTGFGADGVIEGENYSISEILTYAIEDEYMAKAEYEAIIEEFGVERPFTNIVKAEDMHINLLLPLLEKYGVSVPENDAEIRVVLPSSLLEAFEIGVIAEEKNISMYQQFQNEDLPDDINNVIERLIAGSLNHLSAFERGVLRDGEWPTNIRGNGKINDDGNQIRENKFMRNQGANSRLNVNQFCTFE